MARQARNILTALAQRRKMDTNHVQAVEQVFAEFPFLNASFEVLVGGGDNAHIDFYRRVPAHAVELSVSQHA